MFLHINHTQWAVLAQKPTVKKKKNLQILCAITEKDSLSTFEAESVGNLRDHFHMLCSDAEH